MNAGPSTPIADLFQNTQLERDVLAVFMLPGLEPIAEELVIGGVNETLFVDTVCRRISPYVLGQYAQTGKCDPYAVKAAVRASGLTVLEHEWTVFDRISDGLELDNAQGAISFLQDLADRRRARHLTHEALVAIERGSDHVDAWAAMQAAFEQSIGAHEIGWELQSIESVRGLSADVMFPKPLYGRREDGAKLLPLGCVLGLVGPPAGGKSMCAIALATEVMAAGGRVAYFDFESVIRRVGGRVLLHAVGDTHSTRFNYRSVEKGLGPLDVAYIRRLYRDPETKPTLVVLDGINRLLGLHNVKNANDATEVSRVIAATVDRFRDDNVAVVTVDHTAKSSTGEPMGSRAKLALMDYCLLVSQPDPSAAITKGRGGYSWIEVIKDRDGDLSSQTMDGTKWGRFAVESNRGGRWSHTFQLPGGGYA